MVICIKEILCFFEKIKNFSKKLKINVTFCYGHAFSRQEG